MPQPRIASLQASMRPALLQEPAGRGVRCLTCERRCELEPGALGWCRTRRNEGGQLVTLTYGAVSSLSANPIEKKPLYHFHPGTVALTCGSWSCNFDCHWCQNYGISKVVPGIGLTTMLPEEFVDRAAKLGCQGTSISLNEPTLSLEWSLDVFRLARQLDLYNTYVTNGYMTPQALQTLVEAGLDAMNVDVKGDAGAVRRYCGIDVELVWRNCRLAAQAGVWLEITTLVIPGVNDTDEVLRGIAERIASDLGQDVPWHVSGYYPAYRFQAPPTPLGTLERAWRLAKDAGLRHVYVGNAPGHRWDNTYCPDCDSTLVARQGFAVRRNWLEAGRCPVCGSRIPGVWG